MNKIKHQHYGKQRVRVLRVHRATDIHEVFEFDAGIALEGDFDASYTSSDNSSVVPTDTMKNTLHVLAYRFAPRCLEDFALAVARHFLDKYAHVSAVSLEITQKLWTRIETSHGPHPHAFRGGPGERPYVKVYAPRGKSPVIRSGVRDLLLMKTTESGFEGYPRCEFTTLPETNDRILATLAVIEWLYGAQPPTDFSAARERAMNAMIEIFATEYSPSVQRTIYQMGSAALAAVPEIHEITLALPNKHYLPISLEVFGDPPQKEVFLPTDEPHGQIEATLTRS